MTSRERAEEWVQREIAAPPGETRVGDHNVIVRSLTAALDAHAREAVEAEVKDILKYVNFHWSFDKSQQHTHTWHDKQDCLAAIRARSEEG